MLYSYNGIPCSDVKEQTAIIYNSRYKSHICNVWKKPDTKEFPKLFHLYQFQVGRNKLLGEKLVLCYISKEVELVLRRSHREDTWGTISIYFFELWWWLHKCLLCNGTSNSCIPSMFDSHSRQHFLIILFYMTKLFLVIINNNNPYFLNPSLVSKQLRWKNIIQLVLHFTICSLLHCFTFKHSLLRLAQQNTSQSRGA